MGRREGSFTPEALLEGEWRELGLEDDPQALAGELHQTVRELRRHDARVDQALADGLARFEAGGDCSFGRLGHSNASDACEMRFGFSWSHARELIAIRRGLRGLPALEAAFLAGDIGRGKLRALVRVATPGTDRGWLAWSRARSARTLEADIAAFREGELQEAALGEAAAREDEVRACPPEPPSAERDWTWLSFTATPAEKAAWRNHGRELVSMVVGERLPQWQALEYVAADVLAGSPEAPGGACACVRHGHDGNEAGPCILRDDLDRRGAREARRERRGRRPGRRRLLDVGARVRVPDAASPIEPPDPRLAAGDAAVLQVLRVLVGLRERIAFERGRLLSWMDGRQSWRHLGAKSMAHYALHALDVSPQELRAALDLQTCLASLPHLTRAWAEGRLTQRAVTLVSRVASPRTDLAWTRHAERASLKRLEVEVRWHETQLALLQHPEYDRVTRGGMPRPDLRLAELRPDPLEVFGIRERERALRPRKLETSACAVKAAGACEPDPLVAELVATWFRVGHFGFRAPADVAPVVRAALEALRLSLGTTATDGACLVQALRQFAHDNVEPGLARRQLRQPGFDVLERDSWQCGSALCRSRRHLNVHHVRYRSAGGSDDPDNLLTLCTRCHRLLHDGLMAITGTASDGFVQVVLDETWREGLLVKQRAA